MQWVHDHRLLLTMKKVILAISVRLDMGHAMQDQKSKSQKLPSKNRFSLGIIFKSPVPISQIFVSGQYRVLVV